MKIIPFLLPILFLTNCTTNKQAFSSWGKTDSLQQTTHLSIQTTQIPESHACLTIPGTALKELPAGAAFIQKSGQATAKVQFVHDTLFVTATCDSLWNLVYQYEEEVKKISEESSKTTQDTKKHISSPFPFLLLIIFIIVPIFLKYIRYLCPCK